MKRLTAFLLVLLLLVSSAPPAYANSAQHTFHTDLEKSELEPNSDILTEIVRWTYITFVIIISIITAPFVLLAEGIQHLILLFA